MPTSHLHQLNEIVEVMTLIKPQTLLDVGVGFGKYGVLAREYLELRDGRLQYHDWQRRIDGIEIFADYVTPLHEFIYDQLYIGNAAHILPTLPVRYDLILLIDVLEHFSQEEGLAFLGDCVQAGRNVLISTPHLFYAQRGAFNNPFERHLSHWSKKDLALLGPACFVPNEQSLICLVGADAALVSKHLYHLRRRLKRSFPFLQSSYRLAKRLWRVSCL